MQNKTRTVANFINCNKPHILNQLNLKRIYFDIRVLHSNSNFASIKYLVELKRCQHFKKPIVNFDSLMNEPSSGLQVELWWMTIRWQVR